MASVGPQRTHSSATIPEHRAAGHVSVIDLAPKDWERVSELVATYADMSLDVIDASTIAAAERLNQSTIATLDHRDFRIVRPSHITAFELIPAPI